MTLLILGDEVSLKTYSSTTNSRGVSTIKIELVTEDSYELSYALRGLKEIMDKQRARHAPAPKPSRRARSQPDDVVTAIPAASPPPAADMPEE